MIPPVLGIIGPTASGKTDLALALADRIPVEIVVADSRQVYRGMDIGTAKVSESARRRVPHHLIDVADPDELFTVADWVERARAVIPEIASRGRLPLLVGGTGLYVSALLDGHDYAGQPMVAGAAAAPDRGARDRWPRPARRATAGRGSDRRSGDRPAQSATGAARPRACGGRW